MKQNINFNGREGRFDVPFFTLSDNENLFVKLCVPMQRKGIYYFSARHGNEKKRVALQSNLIVEFTAEWLRKGGTAPIVCELELRDRSGISVYKKYNIETLEIIESDVGMEYFASLQAIEKENAELRKEIDSVKKELSEIKNIIDAIPSEIEKAKKEAVIEAAGGDPMGA